MFQAAVQRSILSGLKASSAAKNPAKNSEDLYAEMDNEAWLNQGSFVPRTLGNGLKPDNRSMSAPSVGGVVPRPAKNPEDSYTEMDNEALLNQGSFVPRTLGNGLKPDNRSMPAPSVGGADPRPHYQQQQQQQQQGADFADEATDFPDAFATPPSTGPGFPESQYVPITQQKIASSAESQYVPIEERGAMPLVTGCLYVPIEELNAAAVSGASAAEYAPIEAQESSRNQGAGSEYRSSQVPIEVQPQPGQVREMPLVTMPLVTMPLVAMPSVTVPLVTMP